MIIFEVAVPMPPSVNMMFRNVAGVGRVRSGAYKDWAKEAGWMVKARRNGCYDGVCSVTVEIRPKNRRAFDLDNRMKAVLDILVTCGVIKDDSNKHIKSLTIREVASGPDCKITVESYE